MTLCSLACIVGLVTNTVTINGAQAVRTNRDSATLNGVEYVWSIFDNAWVTLSYWKWVNGR